MSLCTAKSKRTGDPCQRPPIQGRTVCYHHGGMTLQGIASPTFKTGRYSKYLPNRLLERYREALDDPELLALKDDIGLLDTRIGQVVAALDTGESRESWLVLSEAWSQLDQEMAMLLDEGEVPETMERTVASLGQTIRNGLSEGYVWSEVRGLLKERQALVAGEQKRLVEMEQYVTATQAMGFVASVMASVKRHVHDRDALAAVAADLTRLSLRASGQPAGSEQAGG